MNLPNKLTVLRIFMIPIFIIIVSVPMDWGTISFGDTTLAVTQLVGAIILQLLVLQTGWMAKLPVHKAW